MKPKPGQKQFRNQYNEDCPYMCCKFQGEWNKTMIFVWYLAFLNHSDGEQWRAHQRAVIMAAYSFMSPKDPKLTASQEVVARRAGCRRETVGRALKQAVVDGWLVENRGTGRRTNEYRPGLPGGFYAKRSVLSSKPDDEFATLPHQEQKDELRKLSHRLKANKQRRAEQLKAKPLPEGKQLHDLPLSEVFSVHDEHGYSREEIIAHARDDEVFRERFEEMAEEERTEDALFQIVTKFYEEDKESSSTEPKKRRVVRHKSVAPNEDLATSS